MRNDAMQDDTINVFSWPHSLSMYTHLEQHEETLLVYILWCSYVQCHDIPCIFGVYYAIYWYSIIL